MTERIHSDEEVAVKRRKLNGGQVEGVFTNEENNKKCFTERLSSFLSKTVSPIRSFLGFMRHSTNNSEKEIAHYAVEGKLLSKRKGNGVVVGPASSVVDGNSKIMSSSKAKFDATGNEDGGFAVLAPKINEDHIYSAQCNHRDSLFKSSDALRYTSDLQHPGISEDEEIEALETKIALEDDQREEEAARDDDEVQIVKVVVHSEVTGDARETSVAVEDTYYDSSPFLPAKVAANLRKTFRLRNSDVAVGIEQRLYDPRSQQEDYFEKASVASSQFSVSRSHDTASIPVSDHGSEKRAAESVSRASTPFSFSVPQSSNVSGSMTPLFHRSASRNTADKFGRRKLNEFSRFYRLSSSKVEVSTSTEMLERGRNLLNQIVLENATPFCAPSSSREKEDSQFRVEDKTKSVTDTASVSVALPVSGDTLADAFRFRKKSSLEVTSRRSISVDSDAFEARLETEKSNSALTRDRLLRHMQETELRQKRAQALTLEKTLRETARRDEEISLEEEIRKKLTVSGYIFRERKLRFEKIEFPELDEDALGIVDMVWHCGNSRDEKFGERITRKDLLTLRGLDWLNDEVIDTYLALICERAKKDTSLPKVYAFTTFFYTNLAQHGYSKVKRWTRKVDIFSYDILLVPVHLGAHWCLAVIDFTRKRIEYYDSMGGTNNKCLTSLRAYLHEESLDKRKKPFGTEDWEFFCRQDIPQQMNGSDCGMFTCKFAEFASRRAKIVFSQENMPYYRQRMVYEICKKTLM